MSLNLVIKKTGGASQEFSVDVDPSSTVYELKEKISATVELPADNIRLVCAGRVWDNVATIESYNVAAGSRVHCLNNPTRTAPAAAAQTVTAANPMQQMMASAMSHPLNQTNPNSSDPMEQMHAQVQQQMMQNPEMMQQMMNSPIMQNMMSNPEMLRGMMRMNPRMNQLMEQRPEIARMLEDPEVIQQSMRMMQNPELMREMVRNQDRAMGNLDVMPGGHQALMRAHEELVDPIHAAMSGSHGAASAADQPTYNNTAAEPNNEALPNPWGAPASAPTSAPAVTPPPMSAAAPAPAAAPASAAPNPMQQMMQQMMNNPAMMQGMMGNPAMQQMPNAPPAAPFQPGGAAPNAFQQRIQQVLNDPAMMQRAMAMTTQMWNAQNPGAPPPITQTDVDAVTSGGALGGPPQNTGVLGGPPPTPGALGGPPPSFAGANPMQQMMQQMMGNPAMMQQMQQQMNGGQQGGQPEVSEAVLRARFASQLMQLAGMGFTDESTCLRALAQHNGRLDSAIDVLLSGGIQ